MSWIICLALFSLVASLPPGCTNPDIVTLQLKWLLQGQFSGYSAAQEQGYYTDECIRLSLRPGGPQIDAIEELRTGRAQFAISWLTSTLQARVAEGGDDVILLAQMFRRASVIEIMNSASGLVTVSDLKGKTVCVWGGGNELDLRMAFNQSGLYWPPDWETNSSAVGDAILVPQPFDMLGFLSGRCDAAAATRYNELAQVLTAKNPKTGKLWTLDELNIIDFNELRTAQMEDGIVANATWVEQNLDLTIRFLRASFKGWMFCRDFPAECVKYYIDDSALQEWQIAEVNKLVWPSPLGLGIVEMELLQRTADISFQYNQLSKSFNTSTPGFYRSDLVYQALMTMNNSTNTWGPTQYGPGSSDFYALDYKGQNLSFCLSSNGPIICPPVLEEDSNTYMVYGDARATLLLFFSSLCIFIVGTIAFLLIYYREHDVIKASSYLFCFLMCLGGLMGLCNVFLVLGAPTKMKCNIRPWLLAMGFIILFGSFMVKTYRIHRIFNNSKIRRIYYMTDIWLCLRLSVLVAIEAFLILVLNIVGDIDVVVRQNPTNFRTITQCAVSNGAEIMTVIFVLNGLLVLFSVYLAWTTRAVRTSYNESKFLAIAIYTLVLSLIIILPTLSTDIAPATGHVIQCLGVMVAVVGSLVTVFAPKFWIIFHYEEYKMKLREKNQDKSHPSSPASNAVQLMEVIGNPEFLAVASLETIKEMHMELSKVLGTFTYEIERRTRAGEEHELSRLQTESSIT